ncbi:MAG: phenylacetate-CoA oxygenase subunit PaaC [Chloroflexi bacterium]|nr:phenylacetate-CoA oxygenase subunit PaaC [Chloroflexota bacterium]
MDKTTRQALANYLIAMGDDELILGQRDAEWCGHAPILEEDIAFANISLDEIGHANVWYGLATELLGEQQDSYPDWLAFRRDAADFRNIQMVELPKGDWAFSILRQFLFDSFEVMRLERLKDSMYKPLADAAAKIRNEEVYHRRHTQAWVKRLALGTEESKRRMQTALDELWGYARQMGVVTEGGFELEQGSFLPNSEQLRIAWIKEVSTFMHAVELTVRDSAQIPAAGWAEHSQHFDALITEMQEVPRLFPEGEW